MSKIHDVDVIFKTQFHNFTSKRSSTKVIFRMPMLKKKTPETHLELCRSSVLIFNKNAGY